MKKLLLILQFMPLFAAGQVMTYGTLRAVDYNFQHIDPSFGGLFSVGVKDEIMGAGGGIGVIKFSNPSSPYIPVFGEIVAYGKPKEAGPFASIKIGYGVFQNQMPGGDETGGLYFAPDAGILLPVSKKDAVLLTVGYVSSSFKIKTNGVYQTQENSTLHGFSFELGMKF